MATSGGGHSEVFGGRLWTLIAAVVVMTGVIAALVVVLLTGHHTSTSTSAPAPVTTPVTPVSSGAGSPTTTTTGCPLAARQSDVVPATAPVDTTWVNVRGFELPVTPDGPLHRSGGDWSCYAHTGLGALETVFGFGAAALAGDQQAARRYLAPGSVSGSQLAQLVPPGGETQEPGVRLVGFSFGAFSLQGGDVSIFDSCAAATCPSPFYETLYEVTWSSAAQGWLITNAGGQTSAADTTTGSTNWEAP